MTLEIRELGRVAYQPTYEAMQAFTAARSLKTGQIAEQNGLQPAQTPLPLHWFDKSRPPLQPGMP